MIESWYPFFEWCEFTTIGQAIRSSLWLFPVIEAFHLVAFALLGGSVLVVDLRLLGVLFRQQSAAELWHSARVWRWGALAAIAVTGVLLFLSESVKLYYSEPFWIKITALILAVIFTFAVTRRVATTSDQSYPLVTGLVAIATLVGMLVAGYLIFFTDQHDWSTILWIGAIVAIVALVSPLVGRALNGSLEGPIWARLAAVLSILLWGTVAWGGRWIGFSG